MPFLKPNVSRELLAEIERAEGMHAIIQKTIPDKFAAYTDETILAAASFPSSWNAAG